MSESFDLDMFWGMLLSRDTERIRVAWAMLAHAERAAVHAHLQRMTVEDGWLEGQRAAAQAAVDALGPDAPDSPGES